MKPKYSIVIPAFREESTIFEVVKKTIEIASGQGLSYEIIVVNDGSQDQTAERAEIAGAKVISHPHNKGYGAALKTGIRAALGSTVILMDADGQHKPSDIPRLIEEEKHYDMIVGARQGLSGSPLWRKPGKFILAKVVNNLIGQKVPDFNSGFRIIEKNLALRILPLMPNGFSFSTTSTIACFRGGFNVGFLPINIAKRESGKSSVTAADGFRTLLLILRLITVFAPLRVFLPVSLCTMLIGLVFTTNGYLVSGEASIKGILMLLASLHFFLFGILVDQVSALRRGEAVSDLETHTKP